MRVRRFSGFLCILLGLQVVACPPASAAEDTQSQWDAFTKGTFEFSKPKGLFGILGVIQVTSQDLEIADQEYKNHQWKELARYVMAKRTGRIDIDFFYLAEAAVNLGFLDAGRIYALKSAAISRNSQARCQNIRFPNGGTFCPGQQLPLDAQRLVNAIDKTVAERKREAQQQAARMAQAAEQKRLQEARAAAAEKAERQREQAAAAAKAAHRKEIEAKFPAEWVGDILAGQITKGMSEEAVLAARGTPVRKETIPPDLEMWTYRSERVVFTGGKVTYFGS